MPRTFRVEVAAQSDAGVELRVGFVGEAENDRRVVDAVAAIKELKLQGGSLVRFDGPCSLPVAMALAHEVAHLYGAVAVKDPKLGKFVVAISHRPDLAVGELLE
jgi:CRISPR-associated protein Csx3